MKRWHEEVPLMLRRWAVEKASHAMGALYERPPLPVEEYFAKEERCHCLRGPGTMRKRAPGGHHHRCYMCKGDKYEKRGRVRKEGTGKCGRANHRDAAWQHEQEANGIEF